MAEDSTSTTPAGDNAPPPVAATPATAMEISERKLAFMREMLAQSRQTLSDFKPELQIYRVASIAAVLLIAVVSVRTFLPQAQPDKITLGTFVGSGGLFAATGGWATFFLQKQLNLIEKLMFSVLGASEK